ncbi:hypothetical protein HOC32_05140 [Candidatus Woesearchaeota archaeon]|nr:hypothetical protein [Candidatus Woesearchaeota archaeon]
MKHSVKITIFLLLLFLLAQYVGLGIVEQYVDVERSAETGITEFKDLPIGERPPIQERTSFLPIILVILGGTVIMLLLVKHKLTIIWKGWFLMAVFIALTIAWDPFMPTVVAFILAAFFAAWKLWKPNIFVHNFTELFIYGGLAAIFVSWFDILSISILLVLIAVYDAYAVWKSKHMITLAKSQTKEGIFAGLLIPYKLPSKRKKGVKTKKVRTALLGGGDIGFPLIFAGVVFKELGLWQAMIIPIFAMLGLALLLFFSKDKKFYPAMPFIGAGCFVGLGIVYLLMFLI